MLAEVVAVVIVALGLVGLAAGLMAEMAILSPALMEQQILAVAVVEAVVMQRRVLRQQAVLADQVLSSSNATSKVRHE